MDQGVVATAEVVKNRRRAKHFPAEENATSTGLSGPCPITFTSLPSVRQEKMLPAVLFPVRLPSVPTRS